MPDGVAGDGGVRGGMAAGRGAAAATGGGWGFGPSSSAIILRMEARISSIDGSCAFAGWLIAKSPHVPQPDAGNDPAAANHLPHALCTRNLPGIHSDRCKYRTAPGERQNGLVDTPMSAGAGDPEVVNYFPSGVRTPVQLSRT
jgi:hypothetical protein